jgi:hypothetical protein
MLFAALFFDRNKCCDGKLREMRGFLGVKNVLLYSLCSVKM